MLTVLDLFSGIGGISLGLERTGGFKTVAFCEVEPYCQQVLRRHWPDVPVYGDVRELHAEQCGAVDVVVGGFPCQPVSVAGRRRGHEDHRWLWPAMCRLVRELRPRWVLAENVPGLRTLGADRVLGDLEAAHYACWPLVVGARHVGAPHRRDRVWIVGHASSERRAGVCVPVRPRRPQQAATDADGSGAGLADSDRVMCDGRTDQPERGAEGRVAVGGSGPAVDHPLCSGPGESGEADPGQGFDSQGQRSGDAARGAGHAVADARCEGLERQRARAVGTGAEQPMPSRLGPTRWPSRPGEPQHDWEPPRTVPRLGRVPDGVPARLDARRRRNRLRALGNAVVPQVVEAIGRALLAAEEEGK